MLDLLEPSEDEILDLLVPVLVDDVAPPEEGLASLSMSLDRKFGTGTAAIAPVVPLHRHFVRVATGVAAAVVALAIGLAVYGVKQASRPSQTPTRLGYATAALRHDLRSGNSPTRIEKDITNLAHAMSGLPAAGRTATAAPSQLLASACRWLEGSSEPSASLPPACRMVGSSGRPANSAPPNVTNPGDGARPGPAPDRGSLDPTHQGSGVPGSRPDQTSAGGNPSKVNGVSGGSKPSSDGYRPSSDGSLTAAPRDATTASPAQTSSRGRAVPGNTAPQDPTSPGSRSTASPTDDCAVDACSSVPASTPLVEP